MMNKRLKALWLKALRSGRFKQGERSLFRRNRDTKQKEYCCLGVLCVVAGAKHRPNGYHYEGVAQDCFLPLPLLKRAKLSDEEQRHLARMNDHGSSFEKIADYIEKKF